MVYGLGTPTLLPCTSACGRVRHWGLWFRHTYACPPHVPPTSLHAGGGVETYPCQVDLIPSST